MSGSVVWLLRGYQRVLSPLLAGFGAHCRFEPSCSQYMIDAVESRGVVTGLAIGCWRVLRCNPLNAGGYDPVVRDRAAEDVSRETV